MARSLGVSLAIRPPISLSKPPAGCATPFTRSKSISTAAELKGVASFGRRPTVDDGPPLLEIYLFDFTGDIYGRAIEVFFIDFLRPEQKFESLDALIAQIRQDEAQARRILNS